MDDIIRELAIWIADAYADELEVTFRKFFFRDDDEFDDKRPLLIKGGYAQIKGIMNEARTNIIRDHIIKDKKWKDIKME